MSSRPQMGPTPVFTTSGVPGASLAASVTSEASLIPSCSCASYGISWTGTSPVGTITVQASNDYSEDNAGNVLNAGTWNQMPFTNSAGTVVTSIGVSGNSGQGMVNMSSLGFYAIRLLYTRTSGTGTMFVNFTGKAA